MHGNDRTIISWAWKGEGKIGEGGQNQEGKQKKKLWSAVRGSRKISWHWLPY